MLMKYSRVSFYFFSFLLAMLLIAFLPQVGWAQTDTTAKKRTAITFDDQLIQGDVQKPELFYLLQKKQFNFGRLIKLRENFLPEMRKTAEEIR
jgi:hypothetical protein